MVTPSSNVWDVSQFKHFFLYPLQTTRLQASARVGEGGCAVVWNRKGELSSSCFSNNLTESSLFRPWFFLRIFTLTCLPVLPVLEIFLWCWGVNWVVSWVSQPANKIWLSCLASYLPLIHLLFRFQTVVSFPILALVKFFHLNLKIIFSLVLMEFQEVMELDVYI